MNHEQLKQLLNDRFTEMVHCLRTDDLTTGVTLLDDLTYLLEAEIEKAKAVTLESIQDSPTTKTVKAKRKEYEDKVIEMEAQITFPNGLTKEKKDGLARNI